VRYDPEHRLKRIGGGPKDSGAEESKSSRTLNRKPDDAEHAAQPEGADAFYASRPTAKRTQVIDGAKGGMNE